jgi:hypothetical protein
MSLKRTFIVFSILVSFICLPPILAGSRHNFPGTPRITDFLSADEYNKAGLSKLTSDEIMSLNTSLLRVFVQISMQNDSNKDVAVSRGKSGSENLDFYDSRGKAVAYLDEDDGETFYLWDGKPVAYLDEDSLFGFNGKHLGWIKKGMIYDHNGDVVAGLPYVFTSPVASAPAKSFKQFKPFKAFKEFKPFKPFFTSSWSDVPAKVFFLRGAAD